MNYSELSDREINAKVAFFRKEKLISYAPDTDWCQDADYCNTPNYAWPIIVSNKINIHWTCLNRDKGECWAVTEYIDNNDCITEIESPYSNNPLRAAMIVYLRLQEIKQ